MWLSPLRVLGGSMWVGSMAVNEKAPVALGQPRSPSTRCARSRELRCPRNAAGALTGRGRRGLPRGGPSVGLGATATAIER